LFGIRAASTTNNGASKWIEQYLRNSPTIINSNHRELTLQD
jgi:hypothetical protein